jgi:hypothetical protein
MRAISIRWPSSTLCGATLRIVGSTGTTSIPSPGPASSRPGGLGSTLDRLRRPELADPGWSVYGAQQAQPVAISGKSPSRGKRQNKPNLLPWVASGCRGRQMVRRGSAVRVRQRASRKVLQMGICCCLPRRNVRASRVRDGYILGLAGTRGHARRLAAQPETCSRHSIASTHPKSSCKAEVGVACSDADADSLLR